MRWVFADTGYWIAIIDQQDVLHQKAITLAMEVGDAGAGIITSEMVLVEVLTYFAKHGPYWRAVAVGMMAQAMKDPSITVVPQTSRQFRAALDFYTQRPDKQWSPTDCASFLIMQERNITEALAYDEHFVQAGFRALLRTG